MFCTGVCPNFLVSVGIQEQVDLLEDDSGRKAALLERKLVKESTDLDLDKDKCTPVTPKIIAYEINID